MDAILISSQTTRQGVITSRASMPRILFPQTSDPATRMAYRTATVERHLREYLQRGSDGKYFSPGCMNLWDVVLHTLANEHSQGSDIARVVEDSKRRLQLGQAWCSEKAAASLQGIDEAQRQAIKEALVASPMPLSQLTREEKRMTWFDHPQWLAEDSTIAAQLLAESIAQRAASMNF